ncbi:MAG: ATP-binding protein [Planctomycetaceae bacterium]|jgi:serine/threonine-protein kinase RsbW|nr:ATP-binding protein [Planctomycetaceae bacterium]
MKVMSKSPDWGWCCDMTITGLAEEKNRLIKRILSEMQSRNWSEREQYDVHLALEEAFSNAIRHGNASDSAKKIQLNCWMMEEKIVFEMTDEGIGFNPGQVPDPRNSENLLIPSGRGLLIIRHVMTNVAFSPGGNTIYMEKKRSAPPAPT